MTTIDELLGDINSGGLMTFRPAHPSRFSIAADLQRLTKTTTPALILGDADFVIVTPVQRADFQILAPSLTLYSQRDPRWRNLIYAGGLTFAAAGCYVTAVAMMLSLAGYEDDPPAVAAKLREAGCFTGALLTRPERIPRAYPRMRYDGLARWHRVAADLEEFEIELSKGPVIIEVDFVPPTAKFNQHFVVAEQLTPGGEDLVVADPWDGTRTQLLQRYARDHWDLGRALYGMRLLRKATPES